MLSGISDGLLALIQTAPAALPFETRSRYHLIWDRKVHVADLSSNQLMLGSNWA